MQLLISERANFPGLTLPDNGGFIFSRALNMAIEAVIGEINLSADKPFGPRAIPFENFVPFLEPVQFAGDAAPELVGIVDRFLINPLVFGQAFDMGMLAEFRGRWEAPLLVKNGIDAAGLHVC